MARVGWRMLVAMALSVACASDEPMDESGANEDPADESAVIEDGWRCDDTLWAAHLRRGIALVGLVARPDNSSVAVFVDQLAIDDAVVAAATIVRFDANGDLLAEASFPSPHPHAWPRAVVQTSTSILVEFGGPDQLAGDDGGPDVGWQSHVVAFDDALELRWQGLVPDALDVRSMTPSPDGGVLLAVRPGDTEVNDWPGGTGLYEMRGGEIVAERIVDEEIYVVLGRFDSEMLLVEFGGPAGLADGPSVAWTTDTLGADAVAAHGAMFVVASKFRDGLDIAAIDRDGVVAWENRVVEPDSWRPLIASDGADRIVLASLASDGGEPWARSYDAAGDSLGELRLPCAPFEPDAIAFAPNGMLIAAGVGTEPWIAAVP